MTHIGTATKQLCCFAGPSPAGHGLHRRRPPNAAPSKCSSPPIRHRRPRACIMWITASRERHAARASRTAHSSMGRAGHFVRTHDSLKAIVTRTNDGHFQAINCEKTIPERAGRVPSRKTGKRSQGNCPRSASAHHAMPIAQENRHCAAARTRSGMQCIRDCQHTANHGAIKARQRGRRATPDTGSMAPMPRSHGAGPAGLTGGVTPWRFERQAAGQHQAQRQNSKWTER